MQALNESGYVIDWEMQGIKNNADLYKFFMLHQALYDYLDSKGLVNTGFCPITGEVLLERKANYNIYGRKIYLSDEGLEVSKNLDKVDWNDQEMGISYDDYQKEKESFRKVESFIKILFLFSILFALFLAWIIIKPHGFLTVLAFLGTSILLFIIINLITKYVFMPILLRFKF